MQSIGRTAFRPVRRIKVTAEIVNQIRGLMAAGHLRPGERLPSEREFSQTLGIGRWSLREAIRCMRSLGLVEVRVGAGTFLTSRVNQSEAPSPRVSEPAPSTDSRTVRIPEFSQTPSGALKWVCVLPTTPGSQPVRSSHLSSPVSSFKALPSDSS